MKTLSKNTLKVAALGFMVSMGVMGCSSQPVEPEPAPVEMLPENVSTCNDAATCQTLLSDCFASKSNPGAWSCTAANEDGDCISASCTFPE